MLSVQECCPNASSAGTSRLGALATYFPGEPVPVPDHRLGEEPFPDVQPEPPLSQLQANPLDPVAGYQREEISACLSALPREEAVDHREVSPRSPLLRAETIQVTSAAPHTFPSRPFSIFVALLWMLSNTFRSFFLPCKEEKIPESQPGTPCDLLWVGPSNPGGLASSAGDGESLYGVVLRPPREA